MSSRSFFRERLMDKRELLIRLRKLPRETEWLEFKAARKQFDFNKLGKYFSAMCNEAFLQEKDRGYIVLGVKDEKGHEIVGTSWRKGNFDGLKQDIAQNTTGGITFSAISEIVTAEGRVLLFEIPPAPQGMPVAWKGHYYGRNGESLAALTVDEMDQIRGYARDWTADICNDATLDDMDSSALQFARQEYTRKYPALSAEVARWTDSTFLNKAKLFIKGKPTRTALLLLGRPESTHFLSPFVARMTWIVKNEKNVDLDYEHFDPPFLLASSKLREKIRNLKYRYMPDQTFFPEEIDQYDTWVLREALHNCIAHQDYSLRGKIVVVEKSDELIFSNSGSFLPGSIENVIEDDAPPRQYRNPFLTTAMANLNMIDTIGSGIKRMYRTQRERFFPMPTYEIKSSEVTVRIPGKVLNPQYTQFLRENEDVDLHSVILLDYVQKKMQISKEAHKYLKSRGLVEGRYPNLIFSSMLHAKMDEKAEYIRKRGLDKDYYEKLILQYLDKFGRASRSDIDNLILEKLPDVLDDLQKKNKIRNLLHGLSKRKGLIQNLGSSRKPVWVLSK